MRLFSIVVHIVVILATGCVHTDYIDDEAVNGPQPGDSTAISRTGTFVGYSGTPVNGTATLQKLSADTLQLNFHEDFSSTAGPSLYVYLSGTNQINSGSLELGSLQANSGVQSYSVPSGIGLFSFGYIIIHCKPYNHTFGYAKLE